MQEALKIQIPKKLERLCHPKRYKVIVGGRGGGKSESVSQLLISMVDDAGLKILCLREFQSSLDDSVKSLIEHHIERMGLDEFTILRSHIEHENGGEFKFMGISRNPQSVKSSHGFNVAWCEESQFLSEESLKMLTPTIREKGSELWFTGNPQSSEDPFSKRFILPFQDALFGNGFYEDDDHLIIMLNHSDNPWFPEELERERLWDFKNLPRATYDWVWEAAFNDSVPGSLIQAEWFDSCIDSHLKLGFKPIGARVASHDPSDQGGDSKGYAFRHGSVFLDVQEMTTGTVNEGADWATGLAIQMDADAFIWDADGLGISLTRQVEQAFKGHTRRVIQFRGSESPDNPESIFEPSLSTPIAGQRMTKDTVRNKRAQYYYQLRERCYKTWRAVEHGEYHNPDDLISFSSDIKCLQKLRSEVCRMPVKPNANGLFELYTKDAMKSKFNIKSPNLADSVMMCLRLPAVAMQQVRRPQAIKPIRSR